MIGLLTRVEECHRSSIIWLKQANSWICSPRPTGRQPYDETILENLYSSYSNHTKMKLQTNFDSVACAKDKLLSGISWRARRHIASRKSLVYSVGEYRETIAPLHFHYLFTALLPVRSPWETGDVPCARHIHTLWLLRTHILRRIASAHPQTLSPRQLHYVIKLREIV